MSRILHTADLHSGSATHSRPDPVTGIPSGVLSIDHCFGEAVHLAIERALDAVVISGDSFDRRDPDRIALNLFDSRLRQLKDAGLQVVIVGGNHDGPQRPGEPSVLQIFHDPPHVYVSTRPEVIHLEGLAVATLPWVSRAQLEALHPELTRAEAEQQQMNALVSVLGMLRHEAPEGSVLALHWSIEGAVLGEQPATQIAQFEPVIPLPELEGPWKYGAFGHIHRRQGFDIGHPSLAAYAGSIDRRNFGEEDEEKEALVVDLDPGDGGVDVEPVRLPARQFTTLQWNVDINGRGYDPEVGPSGEYIEGAIVRVRGALTPETAEKLDRAALQRSLLGAGAHLVYLELDVERPDRRRDREVTEQLDEAEALDRILAARQVEDDRRPAIRDRAKQLMEGA